MTPRFSEELMSPSMVCVLPVPVCPYANTVDSYPPSTSEMTGARVLSKTSFCVLKLVKTLSKP